MLKSFTSCVLPYPHQKPNVAVAWHALQILLLSVAETTAKFIQALLGLGLGYPGLGIKMRGLACNTRDRYDSLGLPVRIWR